MIERNGRGLLAKDTYVRADGTEDFSRSYEYDEHGLPRWVTHPGIGARYYDYDPAGRYMGTHEGVSGDEEHYRRDPRGRVSQIDYGYENAGGKATMTYDGADRVKTVVDPKGLSTAYLRNGLGDLLWQRSPDMGDTAIEHDASGQPVKETPADGRQVQRAYDALGRVTTLTYSDATVTTFTYDTPPADCPAEATFAVGRLGTVTDREGSTTFCYDFAGRIAKKTQVTHGVRLALRYAYTAAGRLAAITYPDGRQVTYRRDGAGRVTGVDTQTAGNPMQPILADVHHDAPGHVIGWTAGTRTVQRLYHLSGKPADVHDGRNDGFKAKLTYDTTTFVNQITLGSATLEIFPDGNARVHDAGSLESTPENPYGSIEEYGYDKTGNRLSWTTLPFSFRRYTYATDSHHLLVANKIAREYDATGNTIRIGEREFIYDASGRMSQVKVNGVVEMNYAYNPFGQQVARYIAGQTTVSLHDEAGHWLGDYDGAGRPIRHMVWLDDLPVAALDGDAIRDIQADHLGTPRVVIDRATDKAIWHWPLTGDAFGSTPPNEDVDKDGTTYVFDMRYPGQRYDAVTGLFQNGWRDYDPSSGRYVQSDPLGLEAGMSTYAYVRGNSYVRIDPLGLANILVGASLTFIPGGGGSLGGGLYISYTAQDGLDLGLYGSASGGIGANIGAGVNVGYVPGASSNISGTSIDASISGGPFAATVSGAINQPPYAGYSAGVGIGLPGGASLSVTRTGHVGVQDGITWFKNTFGSSADCDPKEASVW